MKHKIVMNWLGGLSGYCELSEVIAVPKDVRYRTVSRIQTTMTSAKLRRLVKRGSISGDEVKQYKAQIFAKGLDDPYLELESSSNGHKQRLFLGFKINDL